MKCALVVGHTAKSPGACAPGGQICEFDFNAPLAREIAKRAANSNVAIVYRDEGPGGYGRLPSQINRINPGFIVSMHCNAFNREASGTETLYWHRSDRGTILAEIVQEQLVQCLGLPDRGIKPRDEEQRGGYVLGATYAPMVIAEPFFIDNQSDLDRARQVDLAGAYVTAIEEAAKALGD